MANDLKEQQARDNMAKEFSKELDKRNEQIKSRFTDKQRSFISETEYSYSWDCKNNSELGKQLYNGLCSGKYKKPSEFFKEEADFLFDGYILPRFKDCFLYTVDNCIKYQYSQTYYRRSFRTSDYSIHYFNIISIINKFHSDLCIDKDVCDVLKHNISEKEDAYIEYERWRTIGYDESVICYELDHNNKELEDIITDIVMGEGEVVLDNDIIRGILQSNNEKMHKLLGKLLLAARLQEGLRQAICEAADAGTVSAFLEILNVISENNLIRFSSVKRAVGTWIGLITYESSDLERISDKSINIIIDCLESETVREEYLKSEDSMKIYIALWSYGFYEVQDAMKCIYNIAENGTHHQLLTSGYFLKNIDNTEFSHRLAKKIISIKCDGRTSDEGDWEPDVLAVCLPYFMSDWRRFEGSIKHYEDKEEAQKFYNIFLEMYKYVPKKSLDFSPCIFPWNEASLKKSDIIIRLCLTAYYLEDNTKKDFVCKLIKDIDAGSRSAVMAYMLEKPETPVQKMALTEALCDRESYTRKRAYKIIKEISLDEKNYLKMEEMLKYKAADMRANIIELLYCQEDNMLYGTIERLISDKKEEKRTAALDLIMQVSKDEKRKSLYEKCVLLAEKLGDVSTKEKILIDNILGKTETQNDSQCKPLYTAEDKYEPEIPDNDYTRKCVELFMEYFPDSQLGEKVHPQNSVKSKGDNQCETKKSIFNKILDKAVKSKTYNQCETAIQALEDCRMFSEFIESHKDDEFEKPNGEITVVGCDIGWFSVRTEDYGYGDVPFLSMWKDWYEENIGSVKRLIRMGILLRSYKGTDKFTENAEKYVKELYGNGFEVFPSVKYEGHLGKIVKRLLDIFISKEEITMLGLAAGIWYLKCVPQEDVILDSDRKRVYREEDKFEYLIYHAQICNLISGLRCKNDEYFPIYFPIAELTAEKTFDKSDYKNISQSVHEVFTYRNYTFDYTRFSRPSQNEFVIAAYRGIITEEELYYFLFDEKNIGSSLDVLSLLVSANREQGRQTSERSVFSWRAVRKQAAVASLLGGRSSEENEYSEEDKKLLEYADSVYDVVINKVLSVELKRGDSETEFSDKISKIHRIYGLDNFVSILSALGKDTLERSSYYTSSSKKGCLSHLLSVCIPQKDDNADKLKKKIAGTDITDKRLIEAALYSPEWIDIVEEYLGWNGFGSACYYFMAHMNESFDDRRKAVIARYTPLTAEELNRGAFDIDWFRSAYEALGEKNFQMVYNAAKYISDGSKHARARKYADAALGKMDISDTEDTISDKRNKDLLMAYSLIPLEGEDDISRRYLYLQKFLKESKQFGSQRIASEKKAVEIAMSNLSMNAGYADVIRLTLRMETKLIDDNRESFEDKVIDDVTVRLNVDEKGKTEIICIKNGKKLKSVPAKIKKNEYVASLTALKKNLTEQYRRTKVLFEQSMEDGTEFTVDEISMLGNNPVVFPIIRDLVFVNGDKIGFLSGNDLTDYSGNVSVLNGDDKVVVAHPIHLYKDGHWTEYQKNLFDRKAVQPFKQVFRELYVKTEEEMGMNHSLRYAGNQIQPAKTVACLKSRRWVADIEDGLQKVYYKENIVARIYAMADWFSPADIEAPTLEWVEFSDRHTGKNMTIKDIPDIIFSEVMRDVDLAVSVAHAGGVDPETSHSTMEMRAALLTFTLPLFKIDNVNISGKHALVKGKFGEYSIHLGSGVIHKQGGTMINVLPVHSQHRGKLFLPFADDDPKTAEIMSKVLLFADDGKIKDPSILKQIKF
ncbi:MAG: DUF4132 domain-containing protein [Lachnospiraceae bacterium]|nr:DUF4132 domain-containing protein [Lachnospiraceae bacterium]